MPKPKTGLKYIMSKDCRRPRHCKEAFLDWINSNPEFKKRKPTVDEVVAESSNKRSPLYKIIEHDKDKAAMQYCRSEAQYYLRHVMVIRFNIATREVLTKPIRAYIPVKFGIYGRVKEEDYYTAKRVANMPVFKESVLRRAHNDFQAWLARYERYAEFMDVFSPVISAYRELEKQLKDAV